MPAYKKFFKFLDNQLITLSGLEVAQFQECALFFGLDELDRWIRNFISSVPKENLLDPENTRELNWEIYKDLKLLRGLKVPLIDRVSGQLMSDQLGIHFCRAVFFFIFRLKMYNKFFPWDYKLKLRVW